MQHSTNATLSGRQLAALTLGAIGIVYGDIGTSPLYTMREIFGGGAHPVPITPDNVLGILSLLIWSLIVVVSIKYVLFVMRADNKGEGGILALTALVMRKREPQVTKAGLLVALGIFGTSLLYGDGAITPAISVLSAVEGLNVVTHRLETFVVPITVGLPPR